MKVILQWGAGYTKKNGDGMDDTTGAPRFVPEVETPASLKVTYTDPFTDEADSVFIAETKLV